MATMFLVRRIKRDRTGNIWGMSASVVQVSICSGEIWTLLCVGKNN